MSGCKETRCCTHVCIIFAFSSRGTVVTSSDKEGKVMTEKEEWDSIVNIDKDWYTVIIKYTVIDDNKQTVNILIKQVLYILTLDVGLLLLHQIVQQYIGVCIAVRQYGDFHFICLILLIQFCWIKDQLHTIGRAIQNTTVFILVIFI